MGDLEAKVIDALAALEHGRQQLTDALWASIPRTVKETAWSPSATSVSVRPQTAGLEKITSIYTWVPPGAGDGGILQLGNDEMIPVPTGPWNILDVAYLLEPGAVRTLNCGVAGYLYLGLYGEQLPQFGTLSK